jgi:hypothetical protein
MYITKNFKWREKLHPKVPCRRSSNKYANIYHMLPDTAIFVKAEILVPWHIQTA